MVYDEARQFYATFGVEDKVGYFVGSGPHGMPLETRAIIYEWMNRYLKNGNGDTLEKPVTPQTATLNCWPHPLVMSTTLRAAAKFISYAG